MKYHESVLLQEAINALNVAPGHKYIDATLGGGGHAIEIIKRGGVVLGLDVDQDAIDYVKENFKFQISNFKLRTARGNFRDIDRIAKENGFEKVAGILFDLGVSGHQIESAKRGFSYLKSGPLDMRMDRGLGVKAADLLNALGKNELYDLFKRLGEEYRARTIAEAIINKRRADPFETTDELIEILTKVYGFQSITDFSKATSSKKVFQALRIAVNDENNALKEALPKAETLLEQDGRLAVIAFHSLEDRIVKDTFLEFEKKQMGEVVTKKPILPSQGEIRQNKRSKGAKLRIFAHSLRSGFTLRVHSEG